MIDFYNYLIEKKRISINDYLNSIMKMIDTIPSLPKIIYDENLLSIDQQIEILNSQLKNKKSYKTSCIDLGYWKEDMSKLLLDTNKNISSLFEIMIENKAITDQELIDEFDKYRNEKANNHLLSKSLGKNNENISSDIKKATNPEKSNITFDKNLDEIISYHITNHEVIVGEYLLIFSEKLKADIKSSVDKLDLLIANQKLNEARVIYNRLKDSETMILGGAKFANYKISEFIIGKLLSYNKVFKSNNPSQVRKLLNPYKNLIDVLWDIRENISRSFSEKEYWESDSNRQKLESILTVLGTFESSEVEQ